MQNAKDSFYIALRNRLITVNPARTMELRGVTRPGILVEDAEAPNSELPLDIFILRWTAEVCSELLPRRLIQLSCQIQYGTAGSQSKVGLDRGRALSEMDRELLAIIHPLCTPKMNYTETPATLLETTVFWGEPIFSPLDILRNELRRITTVQIFSIEEPSEQ